VTLKVIPLPYRAIWRILDSNEVPRGGTEVADSSDSPVARPSGAPLPPSVILALEKALRVSLIGEDHYRVVLTPDDAKTLALWCGELAEVSNPRDGAVVRLVAAVIDVAP